MSHTTNQEAPSLVLGEFYEALPFRVTAFVERPWTLACPAQWYEYCIVRSHIWNCDIARWTSTGVCFSLICLILFAYGFLYSALDSRHLLILCFRPYHEVPIHCDARQIYGSGLGASVRLWSVEASVPPWGAEERSLGCEQRPYYAHALYTVDVTML